MPSARQYAATGMILPRATPAMSGISASTSVIACSRHQCSMEFMPLAASRVSWHDPDMSGMSASTSVITCSWQGWCAISQNTGISKHGIGDPTHKRQAIWEWLRKHQ